MVKSRRNEQKQLWVDKKFIAWLRKLKAQSELNGKDIGNLGEMAKRILNVEAIKDVEKQVLQSSNINSLKIKMDSRRFFK